MNTTTELELSYKHLMIGCYVERFDKDVGFSIEKVDISTLHEIKYHNDEGFETDDRYFNPIKLNLEIFKGFGFVLSSDRDGELLVKERFSIPIIRNYNEITLFGLTQYVHQLQIEYFSTKGVMLINNKFEITK